MVHVLPNRLCCTFAIVIIMVWLPARPHHRGVGGSFDLQHHDNWEKSTITKILSYNGRFTGPPQSLRSGNLTSFELALRFMNFCKKTFCKPSLLIQPSCELGYQSASQEKTGKEKQILHKQQTWAYRRNTDGLKKHYITSEPSKSRPDSTNALCSTHD